jgi:hypothetical protein
MRRRIALTRRIDPLVLLREICVSPEAEIIWRLLQLVLFE